MKETPKVALVHDWLVSPGGGERVLLALHQLWPEAPIYTAAYDPNKFPEFKNADVRPTWLNRIGLAKRRHQLFSIPRAWAFKGLDLSDYDIVISSASAEAKYVRTGPNTLHICYCHTPIRYYWSDYQWYLKNFPIKSLRWLVPLIMPALIGPLRRMDYKAAQKVDVFVANSRFVAERIKKYYDRDSTVVYPPVATSRFKAGGGPGEYYLVFGRQVAYKRLDLAVEAFNKLGLPLLVAGVGEEAAKQQALSGANIRYSGRVAEADLPAVFEKATALVFPAEEDFGITPVEAMAAGRPVIAYGQGGVTESVVDGQTGLLFAPQTAEALSAAVTKSQAIKWDGAKIRTHAEQFDEAVFKSKIKALVAQQYAQFKTTHR